MTAEHFGSLALPVGEFLALEHGTEYWGVSDHHHAAAAASKGGAAAAEPAAAAAAVTGGAAMAVSELQDLATSLEVLRQTDSAATKFVANRLARTSLVKSPPAGESSGADDATAAAGSKSSSSGAAQQPGVCGCVPVCYVVVICLPS